MHIEPGVIAPAKILIANSAAVALSAYCLKRIIRQPCSALRSLIAALFFTLCMQSFHLSVGPSELHFIGATVMYLCLGFIPTLLGFSIGLLLQASLFEPQDMLHLGVNSLSLMLPLLVAHATMGHHLDSAQRRITWADIVKLDAIYYTGVTAMVGFWLAIGEVETPFSAWLKFSAAYGLIVLVEPLISYASVTGLKRLESHPLIDACSAVKRLRLA